MKFFKLNYKQEFVNRVRQETTTMLGGSMPSGMWYCVVGWAVLNDPWEYEKPFTLQHSITSQKTRNLSNTNVRTSYLAITMVVFLKGSTEVEITEPNTANWT